MRILHLLLLLFVNVLVHHSYAQDVHLTQYYTSNLSLNPAYTGNYDGDIKLTLNTRSQWKQLVNPLFTNMFSVEKKILKFPDEIGVGVIFINDLLSTYHLNTSKALLSVAYIKKIKGHSIRLGVNGGIVYRSISWNDQTFPDQWNYGAGIFDPNWSNNESSLQNSKYYPDFSTGLGWSKVISKIKFSAGYALFHVNRPQDGFVTGGDHLPFRHVGNAGVNFQLSDAFSLRPHVLYMRSATATDFLTGLNARQKINEDIGVLAGVGYRGSSTNNDAGIGVLGCIYKRFEAGLSMDFNISELSTGSKRKLAWEISLIYLTPSRIAGAVTVPCDRY